MKFVLANINFAAKAKLVVVGALLIEGGVITTVLVTHDGPQPTQGQELMDISPDVQDILDSQTDTADAESSLSDLEPKLPGISAPEVPSQESSTPQSDSEKTASLQESLEVDTEEKSWEMEFPSESPVSSQPEVLIPNQPTVRSALDPSD